MRHPILITPWNKLVKAMGYELQLLYRELAALSKKLQDTQSQNKMETYEE